MDEEKDAIAFGLVTMITVNPTGIDKVRYVVRTVNVPICVLAINLFSKLYFDCQMIT